MTKKQLKAIVKNEKLKLLETLELNLTLPDEAVKHTKEIDASSLAKTVSQCVDHYKTCQMHEENLFKQLEKIQEAKRAIKEKISRIIK